MLLLITQDDPFTKTGSGQTQGKVETDMAVFSQDLYLYPFSPAKDKAANAAGLSSSFVGGDPATKVCLWSDIFASEAAAPDPAVDGGGSSSGSTEVEAGAAATSTRAAASAAVGVTEVLVDTGEGVKDYLWPFHVETALCNCSACSAAD
jgi:hypothetical protein